MINKIIVVNQKRVSNNIGTKVKYGEDLLKSNNKKINKFINEYNNLIFSTNIEDIKRFYDKTRLVYNTYI